MNNTKKKSLFQKNLLSVYISSIFAASSAMAIDPNAVEPNDRHYWQQWHIENSNNVDVDAVTAWQMLKNANKKEIIVAVIDSAMDTDHKDLKPKLWVNPNEIPLNGIDDDNNGLVDDVHGYDFRNNEGSTFDGIMIHATPVAGIIAAQTNNEFSTASVTGDFPIKIMTLQIVNIDDVAPFPNGPQDAPLKSRIRNAQLLAESTLKSLEYAINNGAQVINMSLVAGKDLEVFWMDAGMTAEEVAAKFIADANAWYAVPVAERGAKPIQATVLEVFQEDNPDATAAEIEALLANYCQESFDKFYRLSAESERLLQIARDKNILVVAAGLNGHVEDFPGLPAVETNDNVMKIGAAAQAGGPTSFSEYGKTIRVYAPGESLVTSMPSNDLIWLANNTTGTSFATPIVSGIAAMLYSVSPNISYKTVKQAIEAGVEESPEFLFNLADGSTHQAGLVRLPLVLAQLGYSIPQGADAEGKPNAPVATYTTNCAKSCSGLSPVTVTYDASSSFDPQGSNLSYAWDFGDGTTATGPVVTHTFDAPVGKLFKPSVTVTDDDGFSDRSRAHRVDVIANGVDHVNISFKGATPYHIEGTLISGDIDIKSTWYGGRFLRGSGVVLDANGDQATVTFTTSSSSFGLMTGSVTVATVNGTYTDGYTLLPVSYSSSARTISATSKDVDWTVIDGL